MGTHSWSRWTPVVPGPVRPLPSSSSPGGKQPGCRADGGFGLWVPTKETSRISYDEPILVKVDVRTESGRFYWTESVRTREDLEAPVILDGYTGE